MANYTNNPNYNYDPNRGKTARTLIRSAAAVGIAALLLYKCDGEKILDRIFDDDCPEKTEKTPKEYDINPQKPGKDKSGKDKKTGKDNRKNKSRDLEDAVSNDDLIKKDTTFVDFYKIDCNDVTGGGNRRKPKNMPCDDCIYVKDGIEYKFTGSGYSGDETTYRFRSLDSLHTPFSHSQTDKMKWDDAYKIGSRTRKVTLDKVLSDNSQKKANSRSNQAQNGQNSLVYGSWGRSQMPNYMHFDGQVHDQLDVNQNFDGNLNVKVSSRPPRGLRKLDLINRTGQIPRGINNRYNANAYAAQINAYNNGVNVAFVQTNANAYRRRN